MTLVLFDVDGTLVDSQDHIVEAQSRAFAALGIPAPPREKMLSIVGLSLDEAFRQLTGANGPVAAMSEAYKAAWTALREAPGFTENLYPGAASALAALSKTRGVTLGIATGKSQRGVERLIETHGWAGLFATIQTADGHPSKPHPSMIERAMAETGASRAETVMIGDTTYDMDMAKAAGVRAIGVAWGYHAHTELTARGAERVVGSFTDLLDILEA